MQLDFSDVSADIIRHCRTTTSWWKWLKQTNVKQQQHQQHQLQWSCGRWSSVPRMVGQCSVMLTISTAFNQRISALHGQAHCHSRCGSRQHLISLHQWYMSRCWQLSRVVVGFPRGTSSLYNLLRSFVVVDGVFTDMDDYWWLSVAALVQFIRLACTDNAISVLARGLLTTLQVYFQTVKIKNGFT